MRYICPECGSEIPDESEFCHHCGRKRDNTIVLDQAGHFIEPDKNKCAACGADLAPGDLFCMKCGNQMSRTLMTVFRPKMVKNGWIGIVLAIAGGALGLVPGLFCIFGLGHFFFKKWTRGAYYIFLSVVMFLFRYFETGSSLLTGVLFIVLSLFVFVLQLFEVIMHAYTPPKTSK
jgi:ribosomal protein L40E